MTKSSINILRIDSSARRNGSETRALTDEFISRIGATVDTAVIHRDLAADAPSFVSETWVGAAFTDSNARSDRQAVALDACDLNAQRSQTDAVTDSFLGRRTIS